MTAITANGITIEVERHGPEDAVPLLLIRGHGSQIIHWPAALIGGFVQKGFQVIAYDNRDAGLSQKFDHLGVPDVDALRRKAEAGERFDPPYTLDDMAADGIGVLDALGLPAAHALGISMGGMILQVMAQHYPDRLLSATIVMSTTGDPELSPPSPEARKLLAAQPDDPHDRAQLVAHVLRGDRAWGSPGFPFDESARRALILRALDRCHCPGGVTRQDAASMVNLTGILAQIRIPVLVIHGTDDALHPIDHGRAIAAGIPGAEFIEVAGMGHDLEGGISGIVVAAATRLAARAGGP